YSTGTLSSSDRREGAGHMAPSPACWLSDPRARRNPASAQSIQILLNEVATHLGNVGVRQALRERTRRAAVADLGAVEAAHAGDAEACGGQEHLFGVRRVEEIDVAFN